MLNTVLSIVIFIPKANSEVPPDWQDLPDWLPEDFDEEEFWQTILDWLNNTDCYEDWGRFFHINLDVLIEHMSHIHYPMVRFFLIYWDIDVDNVPYGWENFVDGIPPETFP